VRLTLYRALGLGLAAAATAVAAQAPGVPDSPAADHHMHLRSPAVSELFASQIPVVMLPPDLDAVLRAFESRFRARDAAGLAALFTETGVMQVGRNWQMGPAGIHLALLGRGGGIRLDAQAFDAGPSFGHIAGAYRTDNETPPGELGRFLLVLGRTAAGPWRVTAAALNDLEPEMPTPAVTLDETMAQLDAAGIRHAVLLSWAYQFGAVGRQVEDEAGKVRAENDWTAEQAARYPDRFVAFCSFNPLKDYALQEVDRCTSDTRFTGVKLHFTTSGINLRTPSHVERLRAVFRRANAHRLPIVVHMRTLNPDYGRRDAEIFLNELLPEVPDSPIQIAHLAGWGSYDPGTDAAFAVFADAASSGDARMRRVYFDTSGLGFAGMPDETKARLVARLRQVGLDRVLFAIDGPVSREPWARLRSLPLEAGELATIAGNLAPWLRGGR
jgi:predicted TIM-barrel fold metal-dependent hydrolase